MAITRYIVDLQDPHLAPNIGGKAAHLRWLMRHGLRVPPALVCTWDAYQRYLENDVRIVDELRSELARRIRPGQAYAVRSSANIEDGQARSFAGQFKSVLNVSGVDKVFEAIWSIWATANSPAVQTYWQRKGGPAGVLKMAVVIQEMVEPLAAGVALSKNPVSGADEVVVEAVRGRGDALVQAGVTPFRWVSKRSGWVEKPAGEEIPLELAETIVRQTRMIARKFKADADLEWAWDGRRLFWLQLRQITSLTRPKVYSSRIAHEMLPGMIKPLVWSVNIPLVSTMFVKFLNEMVGETGVRPQELIRSFYYRVYFNMGILAQVFEQIGLPGDSVEMMMGMKGMGGKMKIRPTGRLVRRLPHMMRFAHQQWSFHRKISAALPGLEARVRAVDWQEAARLDNAGLLKAIDDLFSLVQEVAYYNILCPILSVMHNRMLEGQLKRLGVALEQVDMSQGISELADYNPQAHLRRLYNTFMGLDAALQEQIRASSYAGLARLPGAAEFERETARLIERFGHLSDNGNDFSTAPWRENPDLVLKLILACQPCQAGGAQRVYLDDLKASPLRRPMIRIFLERARTYHLLRERLSMLYTYSYGLFRPYYLEAGRRLVELGALQEAADIFYLADSEARRALAGQSEPAAVLAQAARARAEMQALQAADPPELVYGDEEPPLVVEQVEKLNGVATSQGQYTGPARVARGIQDFGKVQPGDVLVIPYSDVGWSPLFARVGAVIAESGGLLSHSSIIAREYGIPAVVSVRGAMNLCDHTRVTVNGYTGEIIVHAGEPAG